MYRFCFVRDDPQISRNSDSALSDVLLYKEELGGVFLITDYCSIVLPTPGPLFEPNRFNSLISGLHSWHDLPTVKTGFSSFLCQKKIVFKSSRLFMLTGKPPFSVLHRASYFCWADCTLLLRCVHIVYTLYYTDTVPALCSESIR